MKTTTTTATVPKFNLGAKVTWKSQANGIAKTKTGKIIGVVAAGKAPNLKKFKGLRAAGKRAVKSYVVDVNGKTYFPRTTLLNKA